MGGVAQVNRDSVDAVTDPASAGAGADGRHHLRAAVHSHRQRGAAGEGADVQCAFADRGVRRAGVDLPGRPSRRAGDNPERTLVANMPVLLFCIAFGLSMDYEVFLISRIREYWLASGAARPAKRAQRRTPPTTKVWRSAWPAPAGSSPPRLW